MKYKHNIKLIMTIITLATIGLSQISQATDAPVDLAIINSVDKKTPPPESFQVPLLDKPIQLDGRLNDDAWKELTFFSFNGPETNFASRTEFAFTQNKFGIYFAFRCHDPDLSSLRTTCKIRDGLFEWFRKDDWIEVLIDPGNTGYDYYWLIVNADGIQTDLCCQADPDRSWNGEWQTASGREKSAWTMEIFIPFSTFNRSEITDTWRFNVARLYVGNRKTYKRTVWRGKHRIPKTWSMLTGIKADSNNLDLNISPLIIKPGIKQDRGTITATVQNMTHTNLNILPVFRIARPGSAMGLVPHGWGPSEDIAAQTILLHTNDSAEISVPIDINQDEIVIAQLLIHDKSGNLLYMTRDTGTGMQNLIDGPGPELSLYTTEQKARLIFKLRQFGKNMQLKVSLTGDGKTIITHSIAATSSHIEDSLNIASLSPGKYKVSLQLSDRNRIIARRNYQLQKAAISYSGVVKIHRPSRTLQIDGKPFVAVGNSPGINHGLPHARTMMREMKKNGFNTIHLWGGYLKRDENKKRLPELDLKTLGACFDAASTNGLKVIISLGTITQNNPASPFIAFNLTDQQRIDLILKIVNFLKDKEALLGYEIADEPEWFVAPDWLKKVYNAIKKVDPGHLVTINNCRGARSTISYARASDIAALDYYPAGKWPVSTVGPLTSEIVSLAGFRPVSMWVQGYKIFNPRAPLPEEIIMMSYSMFARGASELFYFIGRPKPTLWAAQKQCAREITSLTDAAAAEQKLQLKTVPKSKIYASLRLSDTEGWIIAVNESDKKIITSIILPERIIPENTVVIFESRKISAKNGIISDTFDPFARHVYNWKLQNK